MLYTLQTFLHFFESFKTEFNICFLRFLFIGFITDMDKVLEIGNFFIKLNDHAKNIDTQIQNGLPFLHFLNKNKKKNEFEKYCFN